MPFLDGGLRRLMAATEPRAILVRTPNWLGDLIVSTGFVSAVLDLFPGARVDLIVRSGFESLPLPHRGCVLPFDRNAQSAGRFGRSLRDGGYSHAFILPPSFSSAWMGWRSGIPWRIGYRGQGRSLLLRPAVPHQHPPRSTHLLQEYLDLLAPWTSVRAGQYAPRLALTPEWLAAHRPPQALGEGRPVLLAPGAEYGPAKQWPEEHYARVAQALRQQGWDLAVVGLAKDRPLGDRILAGIAAGHNLCGQTTLPQLVALLSTAALLISNDSGAMHLAAALGIPQIAVFGSTNPTWTGPINPRGRILYRGEWCSPCYGRTCRFGHTRCLAELRPEGAIEEAERLLLAAPKAAAQATLSG